jgi:hypothetical protein
MGQFPQKQNPNLTIRDTVILKHPDGGSATANDIAKQSSNPAAPLTQFMFRDILLPVTPGANGPSNAIGINPVLPIGPFRSLPFMQLMKLTLSYVSLPGPQPQTGISDLTLFDLAAFKKKWGTIGFGLSLIIPTASDSSLGAGKWQAGPAVALIYTDVKNLTVGAVFQNITSFAGPSDRSSQNNLIVSPTFTLILKNGWFTGLSDFNWNFDWEHGGEATIPVGVQLGRIFTIGKQPISLSAEAGKFAASPAYSPYTGWIVGFELAPIFNYHLGPKKKIPLRGK